MKYMAFKTENVKMTRNEYVKLKDKLTKNKKNVTIQKKKYRRIFYETLGRFYYDLSMLPDNRDQFTVYWEDGRHPRLYLDKISRRDGMIYKQSETLSQEEYRKLEAGEYEWLKDSPCQLMNEFYLQLTINQLIASDVVEYREEILVITNEKISIHFMTSVSQVDGDLFTDNLYRTEWLERNEVLASYRKNMVIPLLYASALSQLDHPAKMQQQHY